MSLVSSCRVVACARYGCMRSAAFPTCPTIPRTARPLTRTWRSWTLKHGDGSVLLFRRSNSRCTARQYSNPVSPRSTNPSPVASEETFTLQSQPSTVAASDTNKTPPSPAVGPPINPSAAHHSLTTFLSHAQHTGLSTSSTVYNGTVYEYLTQETLRRQGFELQRVGGRGDRGIDLVGLWRVPRSRSTVRDNDRDDFVVLRVVVQCKRLVGKHAKIGPNLIRELDGAVRGARLGFLFDSIIGSRGVDVGGGNDDDDEGGLQSSDTSTTRSSYSNSPAIGVLVCTRPATKGVIESLRRSNRGLVWIMLEEVATTAAAATSAAVVSEIEAEEDAETPDTEPTPETETKSHMATTAPPLPTPPPTGRIKQITWNQAARNLGLEGVDVVKRYVSSSPSSRPHPSRDAAAGRVDVDVDVDVDVNVDVEGDRGEEEEVVLSRAGRPLYPNPNV